MMKKYLFLLLLSTLCITASAQSPTADTQTQFCGDTTLPPFPNTVDGPSAGDEEAASYGCLNTYPNPAWFYTQVDQSGSITFTMSQITASGEGIDVDFIAWGPFEGPPPIYGPDNLNPSMQVGCSYSTSPVETFTIPQATAGMYYVILLTNFSNQPGTITFDQTGGTGTLNCFNCEFEPIEDFTLCNGQSQLITPVLTSTISSYDPAETTYQWSVNGNNIPGATNLSLNISSPGTYTIKANNTYCGAEGVEETFIVTGQQPFPTAPPQGILVCSPGFPPYSFDLTQNDPIILNGLPSNLYTMTYFLSSADANSGTNAISSPANYSSNGEQTIYVRITDTSTGCHIVRNFRLTAAISPVGNTVLPLQACDNDRDTFETFDLTSQTNAILDGLDQDAVRVSYHLTQQDLINNISIPTPNAFVAPVGNTSIRVRITSVTNVDCYDVVTFAVIVTRRPQIVTPPNAFICSYETYTLPVLTVGNYFTAPGGPNGGGTPLTAGTELSTDQTIYIYAESGSTPNNCVDESSFTLTVVPAPVADVLEPVTPCETFVLPVLTEGNVYYTATGGPDGTGTAVAAGTEITENTTLYIYKQSGDASTATCTNESTFQITIVERPEVSQVTPLVACDDYDPNNGVTQLFNLTLSGAEAIGDQTGLIVSYHETEQAAQDGVDPIGIPESYSAGISTVYIRVTRNGVTTNCPSIVPISITVNPNPITGEITNINLCDLNNSPDGIEIFDLTTRAGQASANPTDVVAFYTSNADAQLGRNPITDATAHPNATPGEERIYVGVTSATGCTGIGSFRIIVDPLPVVNPNLTPFFECENTPGSAQADFDFTEITPVVTQGAGGYAVTYYTTQDDATNGTATPLESPYTSATGTIYARLTDTRTNCFSTTPVQLEVQGPPVVLQQEPLQECDPNNDNSIAFNLQPTLDAIAAQVGDVTVTIHETRDDAFYFGGRNPILNTTAYTNVQAYTTNGVQTLYIRVQSGTTDCFSIATLQLIVNPVPEATEPAAPYALCDNGDNDTDGIAVFDLTTYEPEVLNTMNPSQFIVSYFTSEADAIANTNAIPNPSAYSSASTTEDAPIFIKVTNNVTGCYDIVELQLTVNALPVAVFPTAYTQCDENNSGDEIEVFDLTTKISEITAGANGVDVTFYHTFQDAQFATNAIPEAETRAYTNMNTVETIFVRVTTRETGCFRVVLMDLRVEPLPTLTPPTADDLTLCDADGNGEATINLEELIESLVNNGANIEVSFYETLLNATNGVSPIQNLQSFLNANAANHTVWVVAENTITGCLSAPLQLDFIVNPAYVVPNLTDLSACDDEINDPADTNYQDGITLFNLEEQNPAIIAVSGNNAVIQYFVSEEAAQAGMPMIVNPTEYRGQDGQTIWVRVENPVSECFGITSFELVVNKAAALTAPAVYVLCDEALPNNMSTEFDLTSRDTEILSPGSLGQDNVVEYFASQADLDNNIPIATPEAYSNPVGQNPKDIFVRVTTINGCVSYTFLTLKVLPKPDPNPAPEPLEVCDVVRPSEGGQEEGEEEFNLTLANENILQQSTLSRLTYFESLELAEIGTDSIANPTAYLSVSKIIYVRASLRGSEPNDPTCYTIVPLELIVNPLPATEIAPYGICQTDFTGFAQFDLGNYRNTVLPAGAVQTDYIVRYYAIDPRVTPPGAANPTLPFRYTNTVYRTQTIWVYAQNIETECDVVLPLVLSVEPQTIANPVGADVITKCDTDGNNDGSTEVDLTLATPVIVGTQVPIDDTYTYVVLYFRTEAEAREGNPDNAIPNPEGYITSTTVLWAMIRSTLPFGCPAYVEVPVTVEFLPEPVITNAEDSHTSCVDFVTGEVYHSVLLETGLTDPSYTYQWFVDGVAIPGATNSTYDAVESGVYTVTVTGAAPNFCTSVAVPGWDVTKSGPASLLGENGYVVSNAFAENQVITVLNDGFGEYQYSLFPDGPWQNSNVFTNVTTGYHNIYIRDITNGEEVCDAVVISDVSTIDYPRFFTPNNDGYNDYWNIVGLANFPSARIYIFDKYGKLLKQLSPESDTRDGEGWDGTFNGSPLPSDDYWFTVTFPDGNTVREFKSHFAMKR
jgi:gliding motility-associated-like protein